MSIYLSRKEIIRKMPKLKDGSFNHWVKNVCSIKPLTQEIRGRYLVDVYLPEVISKIKIAMSGGD